jgi:hypothetical protein
MGTPTLLGFFLAGLIAQQTAPPATTPVPQPAAQEKPIASNLKVRIGTTVYLADGRVLNASASDWPLALNKTITAHAVTGGTLCEPRPATAERPADAGAGWQVRFTPVREAANELELRVEWSQATTRLDYFKRLNAAGAAGGRGAAPQPKPAQNWTLRGPGTTLTLHPGDRIVVDYMAGGAGNPSFALRQKLTAIYDKNQALTHYTASAPQPGGCNAVGMSLEVGLEPAKTEAVVEAELWLVRPNADGTERSERQVLKLPIGQPASSYYFDEARLVPSMLALPLAKVSGELSAASVGPDGKIHLNFRLARRYESAKRETPESKVDTTYRDLAATPGKVLAFQLPTMEVPVIITTFTSGDPSQKVEKRPLPQLSVRLRANLVK